MTKPPYAVPLVAEVLGADWPRNGLVAASLFAGAGGSSLGYRMAGYTVGYANEFVEHAAATYEANAPAGFSVDRRDVREVAGVEILEACGVAELDLLDGSPPCQPFSMAGTRQKGWGTEKNYGDHRQRADDLVYEYARLVGEVRPRAFSMENVKGLVTGVAKGYFLRLLEALRGHGYTVAARILDAQWLGVPQERQRVFVIGVRSDLGLEPVFPSPLPYRYSIADALPQLRRVTARTAPGFARREEPVDDPIGTMLADGSIMRVEVEDEPGAIRLGAHGFFDGATRSPDEPAPTVAATGFGSYDYDVVAPVVALGTFRGERELDEPAPTVLTHGRPHTQSEITLVTQYGPNNTAKRHDPDEPAPTVMARGIGGVREYQATFPADPNDSGDLYDCELAGAARPGDPDEPAPTVLASDRGHSAIVPTTERRKLTIPEVRALCGFPEDFTVDGTYVERWARFGNSVPPPMARAVGAALADLLTG